MQVENIAARAEEVASAGRVDEPRRIVALGPCGYFAGFELTPSIMAKTGPEI